MSDKAAKASERVAGTGVGDPVPVKVIWIKIINDPVKRVFFRYQERTTLNEDHAYFALTTANQDQVALMAKSMAFMTDATDILFDPATTNVPLRYASSDAVSEPGQLPPRASANSNYNTHALVQNIRAA